MREVKLQDLPAIIDFLYCGETNVYQENLDSFLAFSQELQLEGMAGKGNDGENVKMAKIEANVHAFDQILTKIVDHEPLALTSVFPEDFQELDKKCDSMMEKTVKKQMNGFPLYKCKVCDKEEIRSGMKKHIEANHVEGISIPCNFCEKTFRSRQLLTT